MEVYYTLCYLGALAMFITYLNSRFGSMQPTIAITAVSMLLAFSVMLSEYIGLKPIHDHFVKIVDEINFSEFLLEGMLGFLLFAGGLGINLKGLASQKYEIATLALLGTAISAGIIGALIWGIFHLAGNDIHFIYCLLFGVLISPTDPIAVLAIVKSMKAPEQIACQVEGESLFNDGFGLVLFVTVFALAFQHGDWSLSNIGWIFFQKAICGMLFGYLLGLLAHYLIDSAHDHSLEIIITLSIPTAGFALAEQLGVSGALAMVVAGIFIGNVSRHTAFSEHTKENLDHIWHIIEEVLNHILFLMIGLILITFTYHIEDLVLIVVSIPVVLFARYISVALPYLGFRLFRSYNPMSVPILVWGGLRGGLALALAMSIPAGVMVVPEKNIDVREVVLVMTASVVLFSILVQGSTIVPMIHKAKAYEAGEKDDSTTGAKELHKE